MIHMVNGDIKMKQEYIFRDFEADDIEDVTDRLPKYNISVSLLNDQMYRIYLVYVATLYITYI